MNQVAGDRILSTVAAHPWIDARQAAALAGCSRQWANQQLEQGVADGLLQSCRVAGLCTPGQLYALATRGSRTVPMPAYITRGLMIQALLQIEALWGTRNFLTMLANQGALASCASPVKLRCADVRGRRFTLDLWAAGIALQGDQKIPFVVIWDLGEVDTHAFAPTFTGLYRWNESESPWRRLYCFPVTVVVTISHRRARQLLALWREAANRCRTAMLPCYVGVWREVVAGDRPGAWYRATNGVRDSLLFHGATSNLPAAGAAIDPLSPRRVALDILPTGSRKADARICAHLGIPDRSTRNTLRDVASWPLLTSDELTIVAGGHPRSVRASLKALKDLELISTYPVDARRDGYSITPLGIELLAGAHGLSPLRYARMRHWLVTRIQRRVHYSLLSLTNSLQHTRDVCAFFVSLAQLAERYRRELALDHALVVWDEAESHRYFRYGGRGRWLAPDSGGIYRIGRDLYPFFLEVDRDTESPARLRRKFDGYYAYRASGEFKRDWPQFPQVLVIVPGERRASQVREAIAGVSRLYGSDWLPAWVAIQEALDRRGPAALVWREVSRWQFEHCFEGFRSPPESARMQLDLLALQREVERDARRKKR